ncbi:MAG TPA: ABC transporter substrate-binding protein [Bdellovibrionales bacterium]|nr:ABC transporter substrate-binding protein [Bdellovibrionales bacterium]
MRSSRLLARLLCALSAIFAVVTGAQAAEDVFRFHLGEEPWTLDPARLHGNEHSYFNSLVFTGLFKYDNQKGLIPAGAKSCARPNTRKLVCELNPEMKWSDGTPVLAEHYVQAYRHFVDPGVGGPDIELLLPLKNAAAILKRAAPPERLGVSAPAPRTLVFEFDTPDYDFEHKLVSMGLVPWKTLPDVNKPLEALFNGPYKIAKWERGKKVIFEPNPHYSGGHPARPKIEVVFVLEDITALTLFENGTLGFLRRLPTMHIPKFRAHPGFTQIPFVRFDYLGLGPELDAHPELRKALALALDYDGLKNMLHALGRPGCPSFPETFMDKPRCLPYDVKAAKEALAKVPAEVKAKTLKLAISQQGGDDIKRQAEWFQGQWAKNLGLKIEIESFENKVHLQNLKVAPPALFRKGVTLDRPTCLAALETFAAVNPENYIRFKNDEYENVLKKLNSDLPRRTKKSLCGRGMQILLDSYKAVPLGRIHFTMLLDRKFKGWTINELNQIDVSGLHVMK